MFASKFVRSAAAAAVLSILNTSGFAQTAAPAVPADLMQNAPASAGAASAVPAAPIVMRTSVSASEIATINERMSVMQAQLAELELQLKIATKRDEIRRLNAGPIVADDGFTPSVVEIGGADGKLIANLQMQGGNLQAVRVGDRIGGWQIKEITIDSLTMVKGRESKRLAFGTAVAQPQVPTMPIPGAPMQSPVPFLR